MVDSFAAIAFPCRNVFSLFFSFKTVANSNRQIRRPCADAANEFIRLISLINSYLAFSFFFHFSMTTFLQLVVCKRKWQSKEVRARWPQVATACYLPRTSFRPNASHKFSRNKISCVVYALLFLSAFTSETFFEGRKSSHTFSENNIILLCHVILITWLSKEHFLS